MEERTVEGRGPETLRASNRPYTHAWMAVVVAVVLMVVGGCGAVERKKRFIVLVI